MSGEFILALFSLALGFAMAGVLSSLYQLLTARPARFALETDTIYMGIAQTFLIMFAGPAILMRNAIRARRIEHRPVGWLFASTCIAGAWSLCSGVLFLPFVVDFVQSMG